MESLPSKDKNKAVTQNKKKKQKEDKIIFEAPSKKSDAKFYKVTLWECWNKKQECDKKDTWNFAHSQFEIRKIHGGLDKNLKRRLSQHKLVFDKDDENDIYQYMNKSKEIVTLIRENKKQSNIVIEEKKISLKSSKKSLVNSQIKSNSKNLNEEEKFIEDFYKDQEQEFGLEKPEMELIGDQNQLIQRIKALEQYNSYMSIKLNQMEQSKTQAITESISFNKKINDLVKEVNKLKNERNELKSKILELSSLPKNNRTDVNENEILDKDKINLFNNRINQLAKTNNQLRQNIDNLKKQHYNQIEKWEDKIAILESQKLSLEILVKKLKSEQPIQLTSGKAETLFKELFEGISEILDCPVTLIQLEKPVFTPSGHTVEKSIAEQTLLMGGNDPVTGVGKYTEIIPNVLAMKLIEIYNRIKHKISTLVPGSQSEILEESDQISFMKIKYDE